MSDETRQYLAAGADTRNFGVLVLVIATSSHQIRQMELAAVEQEEKTRRLEEALMGMQQQQGHG